MNLSYNRWIGALLRLAPVAFLFWFYRDALRTWFQQDDFAWLLMRQSLHTPADWFWAMVTPYAQGTVRPISERLFFIWGREYFFLDPRPMHLLVALTQTANLLLLFSLTVRLAGNRWAASLACFTWLTGVGLATPMSWLSTYNQVLIAFVFLAGLRAFIAAADSSRRRWLVLAWLAFLLGFGVLELNVVLPALLTAWVAIYRRELWSRTLPFWAVSALYAAAHFLWISKPAVGVYATYWDLSIAQTYLHYWGAALAGGRIVASWLWPEQIWLWAAWILALALLAVILRGRRQPEARAALLGAAWFSAVLGPILPLRDHFSEYYLAAATPGLALVLAASAILLWRTGWLGRAGLVLLLTAHVGFNVPLNLEVTKWRYERGKRIRVLVEGLERAIQLHPGQTLFVAGLDRDLFYSGFFDKPYALFGTLQIFLYPGEESTLSEEPEFGSIAHYVAPPVLVARTLTSGTGQVYRFEEKALRNVTTRASSEMPSSWIDIRPTFIDVGRPEWSQELKEGWHPIEVNSMRWMKRRASLILGVPTQPIEGFFLGGHCPREELAEPVRITVWLDELRLGEVVVAAKNPSFEALFPVPRSALGGRQVLVRLEANRALTAPGEQREVSAAFGRIGFR